MPTTVQQQDLKELERVRAGLFEVSLDYAWLEFCQERRLDEDVAETKAEIQDKCIRWGIANPATRAACLSRLRTVTNHLNDGRNFR